MTAVLLVHGMGRTPLSMWRLARSLQRRGTPVQLFGYVAAWQTVEQITARLRLRIERMADGDYIAIGHSLGGLLLRAAVASLPPDVRRPRRMIMLATPNRSPRLARRFERAWWYRLLNGDAGHLLAHDARMDAIPIAPVPCTVIAGTRGIHGRWSPFGLAANDGLIAVDETELAGAAEWIRVQARHPFIMNAAQVRKIVADRCGGPPR
ncbi:MAG: esterase/lipase family protein [Gemmatimonadales bacterium]